MHVAGADYDLEEGDSIKIHRELPHNLTASTDGPVELLMILCPPMY